MASALNWFEIPVSNMTRATKFYGAIFGTTLKTQSNYPGYQMAIFPNQGSGCKPGWAENSIAFPVEVLP